MYGIVDMGPSERVAPFHADVRCIYAQLNGGAFSFRPSTTYALMQNHVHGKDVGTVSVTKDNYDSTKVASYTWNRPTPGTARPMT